VYNLNTTVVVNPFNTQQIEEYFIPSAKVQLSVPGELGQLSDQGEALLLHRLYREAASALRLRHALQTALFAESDPLSAQRAKSAPPVHQYATAHTVYKLALAQFLSGQLYSAHRTLRKYIARATRYHPVTARMLTLLMCVDFKLGQPHTAVQYFDAAQEIYTYTVGPNHPIISLHIGCLSDLYQQSGALQQSRVMRLLSHVSAQKTLGEKHVLTAMIEYRLAATYVEAQDVHTALPLLENCVDVFSAALAEGGQFEYEAALCQYQLCVCLSALGDVDRAGQLALKCVETVQRVDWRKHNPYPILVSSYFLLGDLALQKNQGAATVGLLEQCWTALQHVPPSFPQRRWVGDVMAVLSRRILGLLMASLSMAVRSLFDSVVAEWHQRQARLHSGLPSSPPRRGPAHDAMSPLSADEFDDITVSTAPELEHSYSQRALAQAAAWERACDVVFRAMLQTSPLRYFEVLVQGIRERAISGQGVCMTLVRSNLSDGFAQQQQCLTVPFFLCCCPDEVDQWGHPENTDEISFAAQAAVVSRLVHQAAEGGSHSFFQL
jgi:tetratricopeptide (TPR) repeat protein